jgi:hypothetical protein
MANALDSKRVLNPDKWQLVPQVCAALPAANACVAPTKGIRDKIAATANSPELSGTNAGLGELCNFPRGHDRPSNVNPMGGPFLLHETP